MKKKVSVAMIIVLCTLIISGCARREFEGTGKMSQQSDLFRNVIVFVQFEEGNFVGGEDMSDKISKLWSDANTKQSLCGYMKEISYNQFNVECVFPQYDSDTCTYTSYVIEPVATEEQLIQNVINLIRLDESVELDYNSDGCIDNLTIVADVDSTTDRNSTYYAHHSSYAGSEKINGCYVRHYNIMNKAIFNDTIPGNGTVCHEFMHTLGYPDLYSYNGQTLYPVGEWDIMAMNSCFLQYPLAYFRSKISGWFDIDVITSSQNNLVLNSQTEKNGKHAYIIKSPDSSTEFFVVEYREKTDLYKDPADALEKRIPGSGLIIYRINTAYTGNSTGNNGVYVFRTGVSSEKDDSYLTLRQSYFSMESGRTSFGNPDSDATIADNAITFSNGFNSGIVINNIGSAADGRITFDIVFPGDTVEEETTEAATQEETTAFSDEKELTEAEVIEAETKKPTVQETTEAETKKPTVQETTEAETKKPTVQETTEAETKKPTVPETTEAETKKPTVPETTEAETEKTTVTETTEAETNKENETEKPTSADIVYDGKWTSLGSSALSTDLNYAYMVAVSDGKSKLLYGISTQPNSYTKLSTSAGGDFTTSELSNTIIRTVGDMVVYNGVNYILYQNSVDDLVLGKITEYGITPVKTVCTVNENPGNSFGMTVSEGGIYIAFKKTIENLDVISVAKYNGTYSILIDSLASCKAYFMGDLDITGDSDSLYLAYRNGTNNEINVYKCSVSGNSNKIICSAKGGSVSLASGAGKVYLAVGGNEYQGDSGVYVYEYIPADNKMIQLSDSLTTGNVSEIAVNIYNGIPCVAYADQSAKNLVVKAFNGNKWQQVGNVIENYSGTISELSFVTHSNRMDISYIINTTDGCNSNSLLVCKKI